MAAADNGLFDAGARLLQAGTICRRLFLVVSGQLRVLHGGDLSARSLQRFGSGALFISRFLLTGAPQTIDLLAETETMTLSLVSIHIIDFLNRNPALARKLKQAIDAIDGRLAR